MSGPVDVLAVLDRACATLNDEGLFNPGDDLCKARATVAELIELGGKVAAHDCTFMPGTQWADMQAFRAALARVGGAK